MSKIFADYSKVDFSTPEGRDKIFGKWENGNHKVLGALEYFLDEKKRNAARYQAALQAFGAPGDFPAAVHQSLAKFHETPAYDTGFEEVFEIKDFTTTKESGFTIENVEDGLAFKKVAIGDKALVYGMAGTSVSVTFDMYGGGLQWSRQLIDDAKYWILEDNAVAFANKWAESKAANHYALIDAVPAGENIAWQAPDPAALANTDALYTANRDAQTLNLAALTIFKDIKDKGYGVTAVNGQLVVLTPLEIIPRLNKALGLLLQSFAGSPNQVGYKFRLVPTTMLTATDKYYVILPKIRAISGNRMNLTIFERFDETAYADVAVGWGRYGGAIGDIEQFKRCSIA